MAIEFKYSLKMYFKIFMLKESKSEELEILFKHKIKRQDFSFKITSKYPKGRRYHCDIKLNDKYYAAEISKSQAPDMADIITAKIVFSKDAYILENCVITALDDENTRENASENTSENTEK